MDTVDLEKGLNSLFSALMANADKEEDDIYQAIKSDDKVIEAKACLLRSDFDMFNFIIQHPMDNMANGIIASVCSDGDYKFIAKKSDFVESHFNKLIDKHEGMACCSDKSRTIVKRLLNFYKTGDRIMFDYDAEYTFHLPKTIFKDHDSIVGFYQGVKAFYYGNPEKYLLEMLEIAKLEGER